MDEKFVKLEQLLEDPSKIEEIFCGTAEEILEKLAGYGIELSMDELNDIKEGYNAEVKESNELKEESLDDVAGGCRDCSKHGYGVGQKIAKFLRKVKNVVAFWDW